jgi:hypothetical protein
MVDTGYVTPSGKIVVRGDAPIKIEKNVETAANVYPGRLLAKGTTDHDIKVADGVSAPIGWAGYEDSYSKKDAKTTIYAASDKITALRGGGFSILGKLAKGFVALQGDALFSWGNGMVACGAMIDGIPAIRVPFVQNATVKDTDVDIPGGVMIKDSIIKVTTAVAGSSIDVGFDNAVEAGDLDGLLDGESCVVLGFVPHNIMDVTEGSITLGALLRESIGKDSRLCFFAVPKSYLTDGSIKSLVYTTSAHAVVGDIYVKIASPGVVMVGRAAYGVSAAAADADIVVESEL